jgi:UDP-N-acetylmuramate dehydrogenase
MEILYDTSLRPYNTFGIDVRAQALTHVRSHQELLEALDHLCAFDQHIILGSGSNVLFTKDFAGLVLHIALKGMTIVAEDDVFVELEVGAGELWDDVVRYCVEQQWGGIENLSLIPGTMGAAPVQNIGAYGVELKDVIVRVRGVMRQTGEHHTLSGAECAFGYRDSIFKRALSNRFVISSVTLRLRKQPTAQHLHTEYGAIKQTLAELFPETSPTAWTAANVREAVCAIRRSKLPDPKVLGNAGSFFKNPVVPRWILERIQNQVPAVPAFAATNGRTDYVKIPAGWLIEQCGWKGKRVGNAGVHALQALVLVNYGEATGSEVFSLAQDIQRSVEERFGIHLDMEVNIV